MSKAISPQQATVLEAVEAAPGAKAKAISAELGMASSAVLHALSALRKKGLVSRRGARRKYEWYPGSDAASTGNVEDSILAFFRKSDTPIEARELAAIIGQDVGTTLSHLQDLRNSGVVETIDDTDESGRRQNLWAIDPAGAPTAADQYDWVPITAAGRNLLCRFRDYELGDAFPGGGRAPDVDWELIYRGLAHVPPWSYREILTEDGKSLADALCGRTGRAGYGSAKR
jgi:predicted ArsR family transcriptional regulator